MALLAGVLFGTSLLPGPALGDGMVRRPRNYQGSLEERAQEAIILFQGSESRGQATEDLILKIQVEGGADRFAWVVPFPSEPTTAKEDERLFRELFDYVEARLTQRSALPGPAAGAALKDKAQTGAGRPVEVLSRRVVGSYDVAVVRENKAGALNGWLREEGYQPLPEDAGDVVGFYRKKGYVFACVKVAGARPAGGQAVDLHPLRFTFKTGGRDGIYFPMKMTGLQGRPFDVNLYVFFRYWVNDHLSRFGYEHRGFRLRYRDWDTPACEPDGGKAYSAPEHDPFLRGMAFRIPTITHLFQKLHPGEKYYLTNIQANGLNPEDVRQWRDDLWLFPYYRNPKRVPYDARAGGPASAGWPGETLAAEGEEGEDDEVTVWPWVAAGAGGLLVLLLALRATRRHPV